MCVNLANTLAHAVGLVDEFKRRVPPTGYERKGVLFSEMFFVYAAIGPLAPVRILESGRARGQSTGILGRCFPDAHIISMEHAANSPDIPVAAAQVNGLTNVSLLFGDSMVVLPALTQPGDVVLIDGPKGWRAIRLALRILATRQPAMVFIHDCHQGTPERRFLDTHCPNAFFSDDPRFVDAYGSLDQLLPADQAETLHEEWRPFHFQGAPQQSYGFTFACLPFDEQYNYKILLLKALIVRFWYRIKDNMIGYR